MMLFLKKFFKNPGTWALVALGFVGVAMIASPVAAPALVIAAGVAIGITAITSGSHVKKNLTKNDKRRFNWVKAHPIQALIIGLGLGLFIAALVLTIGFFTGGAAFAFMAPVFAALAAPFAAAAVAGGVQLCLAALAGFTLVLASLSFPHTLKRLAAWFDSFKYDAARSEYDKSHDADVNWLASREALASDAVQNKGYFTTIFTGMGKTIANGFTSKDEEARHYGAEYSIITKEFL